MPRSLQFDEGQYFARTRTAREMYDQVRRLDDDMLSAPVAIDDTHMPFGHPFTEPLLLALQEKGVDFRFISEDQRRRLGDRRMADGSEPLTLVLYLGDPALDASETVEALVWVDGDEPLAIVAD